MKNTYKKYDTSHKNKKFLLVEDNPNDILLTQRAFNACDIFITTCKLECVTDGMDAVEYLSSKPKPMVVLLDLHLSRMNGFELLEYLRSNDATRLIPVIVLTSSIDEEDIKHAYRLGANSYIRKPINFKHFRKVVQALSYYWLILNEHPKSVFDF
jgi:two-component system response regulator